MCVDLAAEGRAGRSVALWMLVGHHMTVHRAVGEQVATCGECAYWERSDLMIAPDLVANWRRRHHVAHMLRIVWNGPGHPLRFADMPRRGEHKFGR
ncbi:hypothetical protein [Embleya sp. AB8]|uniref:hypothetical protein n=1 Tax=Embleya sp. AB8 TaxID=3156304 RepID=UPI003C72D37E